MGQRIGGGVQMHGRRRRSRKPGVKLQDQQRLVATKRAGAECGQRVLK